MGKRPKIGAVTAMASVFLLIALVGCGCGGGGGATTGIAAPEASDRSTPDTGARPVAEAPPSHCPPSLPSCRTTEGRIVYLERVDPDGDGDAHFVVSDPQGITARGLTAIDVRKGLRPHPLPGLGDRISAAGPVQIGSYGQSQIHALELHLAGR